MHPEALDAIRTLIPFDARRIVDVGARNINGTPRGLFGDVTYIACDLNPGPGVSLICDGTRLPVQSEWADCVICAEVFEHTPLWRQIVYETARVLRRGGRGVYTMAGISRAPHSGVDGGIVRSGEWYGNIHPTMFAETLSSIFPRAGIMWNTQDVYAWGDR